MIVGLALGALFLERDVGPQSAIAARQRVRRDLLHRRQRLSGGDARRRAALDRDGDAVVVADQRLRSDHRPHLDQAAQRDHLAIGAAHVDPVDVVDR